MANVVYPGALHTRFHHTLGVFHVTGLLCDVFKFDDKDKRLVPLSALLHDLGHGPFSHVSEGAPELFADREKLQDRLKSDNNAKIHELLTQDLLRSDPDLNHLIGGSTCTAPPTPASMEHHLDPRKMGLPGLPDGYPGFTAVGENAAWDFRPGILERIASRVAMLEDGAAARRLLGFLTGTSSRMDFTCFARARSTPSIRTRLGLFQLNGIEPSTGLQPTTSASRLD
jgi:hypothetical protein